MDRSNWAVSKVMWGSGVLFTVTVCNEAIESVKRNQQNWEYEAWVGVVV